MILADEPTGNLDTKTGADVIELLAGLAAQHGATVIVATHDAELAARAPRRLAMRDGALVARPTVALSSSYGALSRDLTTPGKMNRDRTERISTMTSSKRNIALTAAGVLAVLALGAGAGAGLYASVAPSSTTTVVRDVGSSGTIQNASATRPARSP